MVAKATWSTGHALEFNAFLEFIFKIDKKLLEVECLFLQLFDIRILIVRTVGCLSDL